MVTTEGFIYQQCCDDPLNPGPAQALDEFLAA